MRSWGCRLPPALQLWSHCLGWFSFPSLWLSVWVWGFPIAAFLHQPPAAALPQPQMLQVLGSQKAIKSSCSLSVSAIIQALPYCDCVLLWPLFKRLDSSPCGLRDFPGPLALAAAMPGWPPRLLLRLLPLLPPPYTLRPQLHANSRSQSVNCPHSLPSHAVQQHPTSHFTAVVIGSDKIPGNP